MRMPPKQRVIFRPKGGWPEFRYYVVEVAFFPGNPIHKAIFCSGFRSGGYRYILSNSIEDRATPLERVHYLKPLAEIPQMRDALHEQRNLCLGCGGASDSAKHINTCIRPWAKR